VQPTNFA